MTAEWPTARHTLHLTHLPQRPAAEVIHAIPKRIDLMIEITCTTAANGTPISPPPHRQGHLVGPPPTIETTIFRDTTPVPTIDAPRPARYAAPLANAVTRTVLPHRHHQRLHTHLAATRRNAIPAAEAHASRRATTHRTIRLRTHHIVRIALSHQRHRNPSHAKWTSTVRSATPVSLPS